MKSTYSIYVTLEPIVQSPTLETKQEEITWENEGLYGDSTRYGLPCGKDYSVHHKIDCTEEIPQLSGMDISDIVYDEKPVVMYKDNLYYGKLYHREIIIKLSHKSFATNAYMFDMEVCFHQKASKYGIAPKILGYRTCYSKIRLNDNAWDVDRPQLYIMERTIHNDIENIFKSINNLEDLTRVYLRIIKVFLILNLDLEITLNGAGMRSFIMNDKSIYIIDFSRADDILNNSYNVDDIASISDKMILYASKVVDKAIVDALVAKLTDKKLYKDYRWKDLYLSFVKKNNRYPKSKDIMSIVENKLMA